MIRLCLTSAVANGYGQLPDDFGPGEGALHRGGQTPNMIAMPVGEVQKRLGRLARVAISPERIEIRMRIERTAGVSMIACTLAGKLFVPLPGLAFVFAGP